MNENFDRRSGIGASIAPGIMGLSPWETAYGVYLWYAGELPDRVRTEPMEIGTEIEEVIRRLAARRLGVSIKKPDLMRHAGLPWMYASPDGIIERGHGFEAKNVGPYHASLWGDDGTDDIPDYVSIQVAHQAEVFGFARVTVAALICGNSLRLYHVPRNQRLIDRVVEIEDDFWGHVQRREPPEPDWKHASTPELLKHLYGVSGEEITLGEEEIAFARVYREAAESVKFSERLKLQAKAHLLHAMGGAAVGRLSDGTTITRKEIARRAYRVEAMSYIDFRIRQPKGQKT